MAQDTCSGMPPHSARRGTRFGIIEFNSINAAGKSMQDGEPSVYADTTNQDLGRKINNRINLRMGPQLTRKMWLVCECTNSDCEEVTK